MNKSHEEVIHKAYNLLRSGGVDLDNYNDDYLLPKIILYVALKQTADQWMPLDKDSLKVAENLEHF